MGDRYGVIQKWVFARATCNGSSLLAYFPCFAATGRLVADVSGKLVGKSAVSESRRLQTKTLT
ncbi:MAG: hypothetical protein AAGE99_01305 [Chlamydiota bacterium]